VSQIAVVTPSWEGDFEMCRDLHSSISTFLPPGTTHYIVVEPRDLELFSAFNGTAQVVSARDLLPRRYITTSRLNGWLNLRRPIPPVRGWIMQQVLKLSVAAEAKAQVVVCADSDVAFIRPLLPETIVRDSAVRFYRKPGAIDATLSRHVQWHRRAHRLLGLREPGPPPYPDYISSLTFWDPGIVGAMLRRLENVGRRSWRDILCSELHLSEFTLYGVFVESLLGPPATSFVSASSLCHSYWETTPMDESRGRSFLRECADDDVAILIQSKSNTPLDLRRAVVESASSGNAPTRRAI
jgi:hypothetical protein